MAVIDPGPEDADHLDRLLSGLAGETVAQIVVTHTHRDHSPGARTLQARTGAPVVGCGPHRAARALGLSNIRIMTVHLLPNAMVATLTFLPFILNGSITTLTSLDFLGFGLPPGSPSLGELLAQGKDNLTAPWLGLTGFLVIAVMLSLLVFAGEAVRDAFDPRKTFV